MAHKNDYSCIVKVPASSASVTTSEYITVDLQRLPSGLFVKYTYVHNLLKFQQFLDETYPGWFYFNVFDRRTSQQLTSFTKNNRCITPFLNN